MENKGYIHVYTGNGKGKTTAAFGLAIRVLCAGGSVFIGQFVKNMKYNETKIEHLFNNVRIQQFGRGCFIEKKPAQEDIDAAYAGLESCKQAYLVTEMREVKHYYTEGVLSRNGIDR